MALLVTQVAADDGTAPNFDPATASDTAEVGNGRNTVVVYKNADAAPKTVTITPPGETDYGVALPPNAITVPAGGEAWIPLRKAYGSTTATLVVTPDVTSLEVAAVRFE